MAGARLLGGTDVQSVSDGTVHKVIRRIVPLLFVGAILAHLDRVNVGLASITMDEQVGLSPSIYGLGVGLFFVAYALCELPSNAGLAKFGARLWIARIMATWGLVSMATAWVVGPASFIGNRVLLGAAEAGFIPGALAYLTTWLPRERRVKVFAYFLAATPIAVIVGGPTASAIFLLDGRLGLRGWQWLFLLEGSLPILFSLIVLRVLPDKPSDAAWLSGEERVTIGAAEEEASKVNTAGFRYLDRAFLVPIILFTIVAGCLAGVNFSVTLWLPLVLKEGGVAPAAIGWVTAIPYVGCVVALLGWSHHSDRTGERRLHLVLPAVLTGVAMVLCIRAGTLATRLTLITLAMSCIYATQAVFWAVTSESFHGLARYYAMAAINAGGTLLAFLPPFLVGVLRQHFGGFDGAFVFLGVLAASGGVMSLFLVKHLYPSLVDESRGVNSKGDEA